MQTCTRCWGSGRMLVTRQIGPGMIQQMAARCDQCAGEGELINEKDRCRKCHGKKTVQDQKILEVNVTPGMRDNQKIVFYGEGDQEPGIEPGNVILVVRTKPHETFELKGNDLWMKKYALQQKGRPGCRIETSLASAPFFDIPSIFRYRLTLNWPYRPKVGIYLTMSKYTMFKV